jgi:hypothetical protein
MMRSNRFVLGLVATLFSASASSAPVVLEWVQTSSGSVTYTNVSGPQFPDVTFSSAALARNGRIILAEESFLTSTISLSQTTQYGVAASRVFPILEISFDSDFATSGFRPRDLTFGVPALGVPAIAGPITCPVLIDPAPATSGGIQQNPYCEASVGLTRDATFTNRYYGSVSSTVRLPNDEISLSITSGNAINPGVARYLTPAGPGAYRVVVPIDGYWQQVFPSSNVPLPSALMLMLTGLGLFAATKRK